MESRELLTLSATLNPTTGLLTIEGTNGADVARVEYAQTSSVVGGVAQAGVDTTRIRVRVLPDNNGQTLEQTFNASAVKSVRFEGIAGKDLLINQTTAPSTWGTGQGGVVNTSLMVGSPGYADVTDASRIGVFQVGATGQVGVDYLFRGAGYSGQVAFFSLAGMDKYAPGSADYNKEAARRALSESNLGHVVIRADSQGAKFSATLPWEGNLNKGAYAGIRTVAMTPGDTFAVMLVPNGTVQQVYATPGATGSLAPLYSLPQANGYGTNAQMRGQIGDLDGHGSLFAFEDLRLSGSSDRDYNDVVFEVTGARGSATPIAEVVNTSRNFLTSTVYTASIAPYAAKQQAADAAATVGDWGPGTFLVDATGKVGIDYLMDSLPQDGEVGIFSLQGMWSYRPGSVEFIREAARRALTGTAQGHIVVSDSFESARVSTTNATVRTGVRPYQGVESFAMTPGDTFGVIYVAHSSIWNMYNSPDGAARQHALFSIASANTDGKPHAATLGADPLRPGSISVGFDVAGANPRFTDAVIGISGGVVNPVSAAPLPSTSRLVGVAYTDIDGDGKIGLNEPWLAGVDVTLAGMTQSGTAFTRTVKTAENGEFYFADVPAGNYSLSSNQVGGATLAGYGQADGLKGTPALGGVTGIAVGASDNAVGYALGRLRPGSIAGKVYGDLDRDRAIGSAERGIGGVTVALSGTDDTGAAVALRTTTDINGVYAFAGLRPGTYKVTETQPAGWFDGRESLGSLGDRPNSTTARNGKAGNDVFSNIQLRAGEAGRLYNFGDWTAPDPGAATYPRTLVLTGTTGDDTVVVEIGATRHTIRVNGVAYDLDLTSGTLVSFDGLGGRDTVRIVGGAGGESFTGGPSGATLIAAALRLELDGVGDVTFVGGASDRAYLYDSAGDDTFTGSAAASTMEGVGYRVRVEGAERVYAYFTAGGDDSETLYDSSGDDTFIVTPGEAKMYGATYYLYSRGFDRVSGVSGGSGYDRATLYDTPGDDVFTANPSLARLVGPGLDASAAGFDRVDAIADAGGYDLARLTGSAGDDRFYGAPIESQLVGDVFDIRARTFESVAADSSGGADKAYLTGSNGDDTLTASPTSAKLVGPAFEVTARAFPWVRVLGSSTPIGNDKAILTDSAGNDTFEAEPGTARLYGTGYTLRVESFRTVEARSTAGGTDKAILKDSAGDDALEATPGRARISGRDFDHTALGFKAIEIDASRGGVDRAVLTDSAGDDTLTAAIDALTLSGLPGSLKLTGFDEVTVNANQGGKNRRTVAVGLKYGLTMSGTWAN